MNRNGVITATLLSLARAFAHALSAENVARQKGLLQSLDPRVRLAGLLSLVLAAVFTNRIAVIAALFVVVVVLAVLSRVPISTLAGRVWLAVLFFTGIIALPAVFLTPGNPIVTSSGNVLPITAQGLHAALLLIARVETAATITTLLVLTTPWMVLLKSLRSFRVPPEVVMMLTMTHCYVFLLAETASQMLESRQSRTVGTLGRRMQRHMTARTAGVLLSKSVELSNDVFLAMQSRGFRGDAKVLAEFRLGSLDYLGLAGFLIVGVAAVWVGRS
jgi:cobalt/nickel transport system permease protein